MREESRKGSALVIVLILLAVLEVVIASLSFTSAIYLRRAENESDAIQSRLLALGAVEMVQELLSRADMKWDERYELFENGIKETAMGDYVVDIYIGDEQGKFNVNSLGEKDQQKKTASINRWKALCKSLKKEDSLMTGVAEYTERATGRAGAASFMTVQHLLATDAVKWADLYKRDEEEDIYALADCVTVWSDGKINVNAAPAQVIQALSIGIDEKKADAVVEYRKTNPIKNAAQFSNVAGLGPSQLNEIKDVITFDGEFYKLNVLIKGGAPDDEEEEREVLHRFTIILRRQKAEGAPSGAAGGFAMVMFRMER